MTTSEDPQDLEDLAGLLDDDFAEWRASLTVTERCDLRYYQAQGYDRVNRALRGLGATEEALRQANLAITNIDAAIAKGALVRDVTVFRGVVDGPATLGMPIADSPGETFRDRAYLSTSLALAVALVKAGGTPTSLLMRIDVSAGQTAAWFGQLGKSVYRTEFELLLPRRLPLRALHLDTCGDLPMLHAVVDDE